MPINSDADNAKLVFRQLERQEKVDIAASDLGELEVYVQEAYDRMETRAFDGLDPRTYAQGLADNAARAYAKKEYTGLREHKRDWERKYRKWSSQAAQQYHRDDLETESPETHADKVRSDLAEYDDDWRLNRS